MYNKRGNSGLELQRGKKRPESHRPGTQKSTQIEFNFSIAEATFAV